MALTKEEKRALRADLFRYLDGIATYPVAAVLHRRGVLTRLLEEKRFSLEAITEEYQANDGYLNVALRSLASQGWLEMDIEDNESVIYSVNESSEYAFSQCHEYTDLFDLLVLSGSYHRRLFQEKPFREWLRIADKYQNEWPKKSSTNKLENSINHQIQKHIEGGLIGPTAVSLGMNGMFHNYFMQHSFHPSEFHEKDTSFAELLDFFSDLDWFGKKGDHYSFTSKGLFFAKRASAFGVTVSYNPTFRHLNELIFGNPLFLSNAGAHGEERHVDRVMNVWGSGGSHGTYFKQSDEIIIQKFNKPLHEQPKGILDMGCGNGAYLIHLFEVIEKRTLRGQYLEEHPLFLVGVDYNREALKVSRQNLIKADIWAKIIWGDIARPDLLAENLKENFDMNLQDLLNVRTFLDHNRPWSGVENMNETKNSSSCSSSGAFASKGKWLKNSIVAQNLKEHFEKWKPFLLNHGLLVTELHTIPPRLTSKNIGRTAATAYDATHGFSDQYILEIECYLNVAQEAGLILDKSSFAKFPNTEAATVSVALFNAA